MSLKIHLYDSQFVISATSLPRILDAVNAVLRHEAPYTAINDALSCVGLNAEFDQQGNIVRLVLIDDYAQNQLYDVLNALAPFVHEGGYLTLSDDDGSLWQYAFLDKQLITRTLPPGFIFPQPSDVEDLRYAHELLDSADIPRRKRGKMTLTLTGRLALLLSRENPNESRTS